MSEKTYDASIDHMRVAYVSYEKHRNRNRGDYQSDEELAAEFNRGLAAAVAPIATFSRQDVIDALAFIVEPATDFDPSLHLRPMTHDELIDRVMALLNGEIDAR